MDKAAAFEKIGLTVKNGELTAEQITKVKGLGCLRDKRFSDVFNVRVITRNGKITTSEVKTIAEAADLYGSGEVAMTSRQTIEIQGVPYDNIPLLVLFLKERGLETGGTGAKVRPVVSCKGTTCVFGLVDTYSLSLKIHEEFYVKCHDVTLPHKFKIAVGGCPNNCVKPDLNDIGVIGQRVAAPDFDLCRGCKKCIIESSCPMKAARVIDGKITFDKTVCNNCGRCFTKCPFGVMNEAKSGYKICIGGRWGKKGERGRALEAVFESEEAVLETIGKAMNLFRDEGIKGERFAETIERLGFDYVQKKILEK